MLGNVSNISYKPVNQLAGKLNSNVSNNQTCAIHANIEQLPKVPASLLKAITFGHKTTDKLAQIDKLKQESNIYEYYKLIDKSDEQEVKAFEDHLKDKTKEDLGVDMSGVDSKITGIDFIYRLYEHLALYKELGMPLPNEISLAEFKNSKRAGECKIHWNADNPNKITSSEIYIDRKIFSDEHKQQFEDPVKGILGTFYHELGHHLQARNLEQQNQLQEKYIKDGLEVILNDDEKKTFKKFQELYEKHHPEIQSIDKNLYLNLSRNWMDTSEDPNPSEIVKEWGLYNMCFLDSNWRHFSIILDNASDSMSDEMRKDFNNEFIGKLKVVMRKLIDASKLIEKIPPKDDRYKFKSPLEAVAEATRIEQAGELLEPLPKDVRKLLYKLGKPPCQTMSYLDEHERPID